MLKLAGIIIVDFSLAKYKKEGREGFVKIITLMRGQKTPSF